MEVWEAVFIDGEAFAEDVHSYVPCTDCHGGENLPDKHAAHEGMVRDPSMDAEASCGNCHPDIAPFQDQSLHNTLHGYDTQIYQRSTPENHPLIEEGQAYHCNDCHTTCGQCHVSQPTSVGGGLISGHVFNETPSMSRNCTACHGSRVKNEYTGANEGVPADVHLTAGRMVCTDCHTGGDMHGTDQIIATGEMPDHRYDGPQAPACESCHQDVVGIGSGNEYHEAHGTEILQCQVCHATTYINCWDCHLERTEEDVPYFLLQHEEMDFRIGRNPIRSAERPYRYVVLRHVPTYEDLYILYGEDILNNFDALPTWVYATPHNIQRNTPQTESCESCHGNDDVFLTPGDVRPEDLAANESVLVLSAPPLPEEYQRVPIPGDAVVPEEGGTPSSDPLDAPSTDPAAPADPLDAPSSDPLDAPSTDPLDAPSSDPLDAPSDPLDADPAAPADPLDADPLDADPLDAPAADPLDAPPS